jgi:hypothetical protein
LEPVGSFAGGLFSFFRHAIVTSAFPAIRDGYDSASIIKSFKNNNLLDIADFRRQASLFQIFDMAGLDPEPSPSHKTPLAGDRIGCRNSTP